MNYYIGVDIGGTNIKAGVVDDGYNLLSSVSVKTNSVNGYESVVKAIYEAIEKAVAQTGVAMDDIKSIGVGCPGTMDSENGVVLYANNLHWENVPLAKDIEKKFGKNVILENDANVAAYGEFLEVLPKVQQTPLYLL